MRRLLPGRGSARWLDAVPDWRAEFNDKLARAGEGHKSLLLSGGGEWPAEIPPAPHLVAAAVEASRVRPRYTDERGLPELRAAIASKLRTENGLEVDEAAGIVVTAGAAGAIAAVMLALLNPGDEVITGDPYYMTMYRTAVTMARGRIVTIPTRAADRYQLDPDDVRRAIGAATAAIVVTSPDNPTGAVLRRDHLEALVELADRHDLWLISDEVYDRFTYGGVQHTSIGSLPGAGDRTITVNSISKTYGLPGHRLGYVAAPSSIARAIARTNGGLIFCPSDVAQRVALAALEGPQDWVTGVVRTFEIGRDVLVQGLSSIPGVVVDPPAGAMYVFPDLSAFPADSMELALHLARVAGVASRPGTYFGANGEGHVRLKITPMVEVAEAAVGRLRVALADLQLLGRGALTG